MQRLRSLSVLALDFDGVVADALLECAAVTWYAAQLRADEAPPRLPAAAQDIPQEFLKVFRAVRCYSRTMDDFMVANALFDSSDAGRVLPSDINRGVFETAKQAIAAGHLAAQAAKAEAIRSHWRKTQFAEWIALHQIQPELYNLIVNSRHTIRILSAKDEASIRDILRHYKVEQKVEYVAGQCHDKKAVLQDWLRDDAASSEGGLIFVDDSVENVADAAQLPLDAVWAGWGYHGPEDKAFAEARNIVMRNLDVLKQDKFLQAEFIGAS